jgi:vacuolar-type H+-ATPase subunit H
MIPLMMEPGYRPTGWLGMLLGTRVYFNFHPAAVETDKMFTQAIDAVVRDLGERSKGAPVRLQEPEPALSLAPLPIRTRAPALALAPARAPTAAAAPASVASVVSRSVDSASMVEGLLAREDKLRQEAKAENDELRQDMQQRAKADRDELLQEMSKMREEMKPRAALSDGQIAALQTRLEALHTAELLSEDELFSLEDMIADVLELEAMLRTISRDVLHANETAFKLAKLVALSAHIAADAAFARQVRRKFVTRRLVVRA